jgi:hypothetical protein
MIDYELIFNSIEHYRELGYERIESPWTVSEYVDGLTRPEERIPFQLKHNDKCLVGSGEQSYLYLIQKGFLPKGKYQTVTPCFRYENFDELHTKYFMKNELIITDEPDFLNLRKMIDHAVSFFERWLPSDMLEVVATESNTYDIMFDGDELGSYGIRENYFVQYIYGTGCAEPRLSEIIKKSNSNGIS